MLFIFNRILFTKYTFPFAICNLLMDTIANMHTSAYGVGYGDHPSQNLCAMINSISWRHLSTAIPFTTHVYVLAGYPAEPGNLENLEI